MQKPKREHHEAALAVLAYLVKTHDLGITYGGVLKRPDITYNPISPFIDEDDFNRSDGLHTFSDASWSSPNPMGGHVVMYANGAISWTARAIKVTCDSSAEAEIASGSTAMKDTRFVRFICEEINRPCVGPTPHFIDNSAAYHLVRNVGVSARTKHFERWMHYLRDMYARHVASIHLVPDTCMVADIFTKPLYRAKFSWCRDYLLNR